MGDGLDAETGAAHGGSREPLPGAAEIPRPLPRALVLAASVFAGAAAAATVVNSGVLAAPAPPPTWPASALLTAAVAGLWAGGFSLALLLATSGRRPFRRVQGWLTAFGVAPFAAILFFYAIGLGADIPWYGHALAGAIALGAVLSRRLLAAIAEKLLVAFFAWLAVLISPVLWSDPVNERLSAFLLWLLRASGAVA